MVFSALIRDLIALKRNLSGVTRGLCGQNVHIYHFDGAPQSGSD